MPSLARRVWAGWKRFGRRMGDAQARAFLTTFYFIVLTPFALAVRAFADPLAVKASTPKGWRTRSGSDAPTLERARQQF